ncbi:MAG: FemAB family PEP-CTERM system-associated protein [gamma proteobacterium symbiont of Ctena orbiculata]|nr:FemAB family PEP-CTERM system-associated protein [Candidatus Thiodiazotropha sp. (ex Lucina pensylvanica)]
MAMKIKYCDDTDKLKWNNYVKSHPQGNFYQLFDWKEIINNSFGHKAYYLSVYVDGSIVGIFPLIYINSLIFGKLLSSMPFVNYGGMLFDSDEVKELLIKEAEKLAQSLNVKYIEIRSNNLIDIDLPATAHKVSLNIKLDNDHQQLWDGFTSKHRNNIRRVYKKGVSVQSGSADLLETFYNVLSASWKGLGTPFYRIDYFRDIIEQFDDSIKIFVASVGGEPIATAFNGYFNNTVEGMWAGTLVQARKLQPNYVLYWEMMKDACDTGNKIYNLGRSTVGSSAEDFKKKWNSTPTQLHWYYYLNKIDEIPQLNVNNPKYHLAIEAWRKSPKFFTDFIGPLIAKNIP